MTDAKHIFFGCLALVPMFGCETSTQPALKDQTVLWGIVATGNTPYFEFWQNTSTDSKMLDPNEFVLYMEDLSDSSHTKYYFQNGIGKGLVIKANTSYKIVWHKSQSNEIHSFTKRTPPAFDPNMFKNINRTHVKVSTDVNLADDELYNIAIFNRFTKRVKNNGTYYYLNYFAPRAETILQLQNYPGSLTLWPCKYLQSVSFNGQCENPLRSVWSLWKTKRTFEKYRNNQSTTNGHRFWVKKLGMIMKVAISRQLFHLLVQTTWVNSMITYPKKRHSH
jgi:hypothetical protein